ncbi:MAG TPA: ABC transporter substrate-binding protein [Acidimicrobiales bacterium]|nr:ABC transporter substrate-binding protein [Acidimicrobiales bacterium]
MIERLTASRHRASEHGFTLIELLVVIVILGVLSAVVVFAVNGVTDKGKAASETTDQRVVRTAEEAYYAKNGTYATESQLVTAGLLTTESSKTDVSLGASNKSFLLGYGLPNGGSPAGKIDQLTLAASGGQFGSPEPFGYQRGPGHLNTNYLFDPMLWKDETGNLIPWLATDVPSVANGGITNGGTTYTFNLRSGVKFSDGVAMDANDVKFTFDYQKTGAGSGAGVSPCFCLSAFPNVLSATVNSPTQVTFQLSQPSNIFLSYIGSQMVIIPQHIWATINPPNTAAVKANPLAYVGTGPYTLTNPLPGFYNETTGEQQYDANPNYFLGIPYVRRLKFVQVSDSILALQTKVLDAGGVGSEEGVTQTTLNQLAAIPKVDNAGGWNRAFHFNPSRGFPYNSVKFRQALAYAIDRPALLQSIVGGRGVVGSLGNLTPANPWFQTGLPTYDLGNRTANINAAKALLASIGFVDNVDGSGQPGSDGIFECPAANPCKLVSGTIGSATITNSSGTDLNLNLYTSQSFSLNTATAVAQQLLDVGIGTTIVNETGGGGASGSDTRMKNGNYGISLVGWGNLLSDPDSLRTRLDTNYTSVAANAGFTSIFGWNNTASQADANTAYATNADEFQALAAAQLTVTDASVRLTEVKRMQELVAADVPMISLYVPTATQFYQPNSLTAWYYTPGGTPPGPPGFMNKHVLVTGKQFGLPAGY